MRVMVFIDPDSGAYAQPLADQFWAHNSAWVEEWLFKGEPFTVDVYYEPGDASMEMSPVKAVPDDA